jgi:hypothetical protein
MEAASHSTLGITIWQPSLRIIAPMFPQRHKQNASEKRFLYGMVIALKCTSAIGTKRTSRLKAEMSANDP